MTYAINVQNIDNARYSTVAKSEEFPDDFAKLQSGDVTTRNRDKGGTVHVKRSSPLNDLIHCVHWTHS